MGPLLFLAGCAFTCQFHLHKGPFLNIWGFFKAGLQPSFHAGTQVRHGLSEHLTELMPDPRIPVILAQPTKRL